MIIILKTNNIKATGRVFVIQFDFFFLRNYILSTEIGVYSILSERVNKNFTLY